MMSCEGGVIEVTSGKQQRVIVENEREDDFDDEDDGGCFLSASRMTLGRASCVLFSSFTTCTDHVSGLRRSDIDAIEIFLFQAWERAHRKTSTGLCHLTVHLTIYQDNVPHELVSLAPHLGLLFP